MLSFYFLFFLLFSVILSKIKQICNSKLTLFKIQRRKRETPISLEQLPQELVSNILTRLPAKDLLLCKRVCKSWFNLITDPHFVSNYYVSYNNLITSQEEQLLVIRRPFSSGLKTYISLLSSSNLNQPKSQVSSSSLLNLPCEYNSEHKYWSEIMGPCNGIYFLEGNPNALMNPSLTQFKALPESHHYLSASQESYSITSYAGFGFDTKTNDYKVVAIRDVWLRETDERKLGYWTAELYSLNSNSWRKLDDAALPLPFEIWGSSRVYTYVNNCFHWWGYVVEGGTKQDVILAFDVVNEVFRKIKAPQIRRSSKEDFATLVPFEESTTIGVVVYPVRGKKKCFDIWVMRDYLDEGSWIKQYSVGPVEVINKLVGFCGNNQFLWSDENEGLVLYESESQERKDLQVYGKGDSLRAARYMESLVSLHRGNEFSRQLVSCNLVTDLLIKQKDLSPDL